MSVGFIIIIAITASGYAYGHFNHEGVRVGVYVTVCCCDSVSDVRVVYGEA